MELRLFSFVKRGVGNFFICVSEERWRWEKFHVIIRCVAGLSGMSKEYTFLFGMYIADNSDPNDLILSYSIL